MEYIFKIRVQCSETNQPIIESLKCLGEGYGGAVFEDCFEPLGDSALDKAADLVEAWMPMLCSGECFSEEKGVYSLVLNGGGSGESFAQALKDFYSHFACSVVIDGQWY